MTKLESEELVPRLVSEFAYPEEGALVVAEKLAACQPSVKEAFSLWWTEGRLSCQEIEGFTLETLMTEHGLKPIGAFLTLDWLAREPEKARAAIERGHDRVTGMQL